MTAKEEIARYCRFLALKNPDMLEPVSEFLAQYPDDYGEVGILKDRNALRKAAFERILKTARSFTYSRTIEDKMVSGERITTDDVLEARRVASDSLSAGLTP